MATHNYAYQDTLEKVKINTPYGEVETIGASFNKVPFFVESNSISGGRNIVTNSLPFSDVHINEDTGLKVKEYSFDFYLVGENVDYQREQLEASFNKGGALELVHPYYGRFKARCSSYSFNYSMSELEYLSGSVSFVPEYDKNFKSSRIDLKSSTLSKSDIVLDKSKSRFEKVFNIAKSAKSVVDDVKDFTEDALNKVEGIRQSMRDVSAFVGEISAIRENISLLLSTPSDFAARFQNILTLSKNTSNDYKKCFYECVSMLKETPKNSTKLKAQNLNEQINSLLKKSTLATLARSIVLSDYESTEEAKDVERITEETFNEVLENETDSESYLDLLDMQSAALSYLRETSANMPNILELPLNTRRDVLSVCFDTYGSLDKIDDILSRNAIFDPLMINRKSLKVLSK